MSSEKEHKRTFREDGKTSSLRHTISKANCSTVTKMEKRRNDTCIAKMDTYCGDELFWKAEGISEMVGRVQSSYHATDNES